MLYQCEGKFDVSVFPVELAYWLTMVYPISMQHQHIMLSPVTMEEGLAVGYSCLVIVMLSTLEALVLIRPIII